ncbi:MAG: antibiotic biosynthesis monooxygenase [Pseudomonadales bacterium]|nr:antibiotic biosynthesis monooxygenase [Pseudomonadales bacterium]
MILAVFRSRVRPECKEEFSRFAHELEKLARSMPGFISYKDFAAEDGERVSIHEWESAEHLKTWREHPEHRKAQALGRQNYYEDYTLYVLDQPRQSRFRPDTTLA